MGVTARGAVGTAEGLRCEVGMERSAAASGEHQSEGVRDAGGFVCASLLETPRRELLDCLGVEGDAAAARLGLQP